MIEIVDGTTDTAAVARIATTVMRWWTYTPETVEHDRATLPTHRDWLALDDGDPVGAAVCVELPDMKESTAAFASVWVLPHARRRGFGTALFDRTAEHARMLGKTDLELFTFEDDPDGPSFLERRGYEVVMRMRSLRLLLEDCPRPVVKLPAAVTVTTLAARPELAHAVWEVACEVLPEIPYDGDVPFHPGTFEEFTALCLSGPSYMAEATFLALDGDKVIGYGQLTWNDRDRGIAGHEMLAVRPAYRGQGVGTALKATQIIWAIDSGLSELRTGNEERNLSARAVNAKFPFEPRPDGVLYRGPLELISK